MKVIFVILVVLAILALNCEAGRRGGGGSRSSSSSGGWFGSRRKSNSNSGSSSGSSWFSFGKKKNTNPQSSYPKQQWSGGQTNTGSSSIGGGGWVNTNNRGSVGTNTGTNSIGGGGWVNTNNRGSVGTNAGTNNIGGGGWTNTNNRGSYGTSTNTRYSYGTNSANNGWNNRGSYSNNAYYQNRGNFYSGNNYNTFGYGYGRQNYGYYGNNLFSNHYRSTGGLFGGGKRSFALGAGAGFLGGAMAGVAAMSMYHQYRMYKTMLMYNMMGGGYHGYGYSPYGYGMGHGHYRGRLLDEYDCMGGCPNQAFCDYGVCRCRSGYDARYGQCWNRMDEFDRNQDQWNMRQQSGYNPHKSCNDHGDCRNTDMNMICKSGTCQCRDEMKWNDEALECQVYIDVNCTDVSTVEKVVEDKNLTETEEEIEFDDTFVYNLTDSNGNLNISEVTADETLATSELGGINPNETNPEDLRQAFCRDMARVARSYEQTLVPPPSNNNAGKGVAGVGIIVLIIFLICACGACFLICKFLSKIKEAFNNLSGGNKHDDSRSSSDAGNNYEMGPNDYNQVPPNPYPPPQNNLYPPVQDPGMPPLGPAIPPTQPGYPANPDPLAAPYPPNAGGNLPYPTNPGGPGYPPYPDAQAPPYPANPPPYAAAPPYPTA